PPSRPTLFPYTTLFRSITKQRLGTATCDATALAPRIAKLTAFEGAMTQYHTACRVDDAFNALSVVKAMVDRARVCAGVSTLPFRDRKSTRLNSSHVAIS